uniref:Tripartite motif-containing protein 45-like n=1 Tax=Crassostrea virginica TaxID=6565 RepID=A0A8B8BTL8_CRAVI|nr:tripartite motif-containing protein 45-like [Crassostrea virginica]XP_022306688.1 tripartite motif-containing protein 45-like [Crassostrea virginica]XP_022306689.1 tripartite motif-containing protein 45-like [Crassostrea virginica]
MASVRITQGQEAVQCDLCENSVSFYCRRCGVNLCDVCIPKHLRVKSKTGHDVVDYVSKDDDDTCFCDLHPRYECTAFCKPCDVPICIQCVSTKHKSHEISELSEKIEDLIKCIARGNDRLQSFRLDLERILDHTIKQMSSLSSYYQKEKDWVSARGEEWHKLIENHVMKLHQELDDMKKENETLLQNQKREFEEMIGKLNETDRKSKKLQKYKNLTEIEAFKQTIEEQKTVDEFTQYTLPKFYECKANESCLQSDFGFIEKMLARKIPLLEKKILPDIVSSRRALEAPSVSFVIDAGFPAGANHNCRLYDMAVTEDKKIWLGGHATELKLFDFKGNLHRTANTTYVGMYICLYNKQVVFSDQPDKAVKRGTDL